MAISAEASVVEKSEFGVTDRAMSGAWRVIIARAPDRYVAFYYNENDDLRHKTALLANAERWYAEQVTK
jgi:hypothetical protein